MFASIERRVLCDAHWVSTSSALLPPTPTAESPRQSAPGFEIYEVLKRLQNGEFVNVDFVDDLNKATKLVRDLDATWPGIYLVRDSEGNDVEFLK